MRRVLSSRISLIPAHTGLWRATTRLKLAGDNPVYKLARRSRLDINPLTLGEDLGIRLPRWRIRVWRRLARKEVSSCPQPERPQALRVRQLCPRHAQFKFETKPPTVGPYSLLGLRIPVGLFSCLKDNAFDVRSACELVVGHCQGAVADRVYPLLCSTYPPEPARQHRCLAEDWPRAAAGTPSLPWETCVEAGRSHASKGAAARNTGRTRRKEWGDAKERSKKGSVQPVLIR